MVKIICPSCESDCVQDFITDEGEVAFICDNCGYEFNTKEMELEYE
ncbi:hypothetical protein QJR52_07055 [Clostridium baratii]